MNSNRSAWWLLIGLLVGFGLPILAVTFLFAVLLANISNLPGPISADLTNEVHVSGPASGPAVAVVDVRGPIVGGNTDPFSRHELAASGDLIPRIRRAGENSDVKALLLSVNSPGGSVVGSDEILRALQNLQKPVVVLMREVAASGGYYVSMAGDHIIANANSLTGSIGVIGQFPDAAGLLEKVGLRITTIKSGEAKDLGSPYRPMTNEEIALFQSIIDETYDRFVEIVAVGRSLPAERVRELADGRIFTGQQALELGLVDGVGYHAEAVAKAAELGGIEGEPRVVQYKRESGLVEMLLGTASAQFGSVAEIASYSLYRLLSPRLEFRWSP